MSQRFERSLNANFDGDETGGNGHYADAMDGHTESDEELDEEEIENNILHQQLRMQAKVQAAGISLSTAASAAADGTNQLSFNDLESEEIIASDDNARQHAQPLRSSVVYRRVPVASN